MQKVISQFLSDLVDGEKRTIASLQKIKTYDSKHQIMTKNGTLTSRK